MTQHICGLSHQTVPSNPPEPGRSHQGWIFSPVKRSRQECPRTLVLVQTQRRTESGRSPALAVSALAEPANRVYVWRLQAGKKLQLERWTSTDRGVSFLIL